MAVHPSDSSVQHEAEILIRDKVAAYIGKSLAPATMAIDGARVEVDAVDDDESVLVEIYAHVGPLKGGQRHKVATDGLKLISIARDRPGVRLIIAFCDQQAADFAIQRTWQSKALASGGVEVVVVDLGEKIKDRLLAAQAGQEMINRPFEQADPAA